VKGFLRVIVGLILLLVGIIGLAMSACGGLLMGSQGGGGAGLVLVGLVIAVIAGAAMVAILRR
jgi:hypothetical protein